VIGESDRSLRLAIFDWLTGLREDYGDALPWNLLKQGAIVNGQHVHVLGPQGIFKPRQFELPLSITTSPQSRYGDRWHEARSVIRYAYRGTDPHHPDNVALRRAGAQRVPLIYFHGIVPGVRGDLPGLHRRR